MSCGHRRSPKVIVERCCDLRFCVNLGDDDDYVSELDDEIGEPERERENYFKRFQNSHLTIFVY